MERDPDLLVALTDRPRNGQRAAVPRQERRVAVDPAEPGDGERVGRDLPGKPMQTARSGCTEASSGAIVLRRAGRRTSRSSAAPITSSSVVEMGP
jgi:hypothetical protein